MPLNPSPDSDLPVNLSQMHRAACLRWGPKPALRHKRFGYFCDVSWTEYRQAADQAAAGLIDLGLQPNDRIAMLSENRYEWLIADQAILSAGAVNVPLHAPLAAKQVEFQVSHSESRAIIVSNQLQANKVIAVLDSLPALEFLISFEPITAPASLTVLTWDALKHRGFRAGAAAMAEVAARESTRGESDLATIIYTSGTTGNPKGVMLSHGNLLTNSQATGKLSEIGADDILLSWLPYSHIYARTVDHYLTTSVGATVVLAESVDTLVADMALVQPTWLTAVPRFYEKIWSLVESLEFEKQQSTLQKIFGPRIRQLSSGGAPLPTHVCQGINEAGIPLLQGYGLTESSPVISFNCFERNRLGTVGCAIPDVEIKIADDGEILTRGPHVMLGYWKNPEATAETIVDGWLHTGDVGLLEDGFLTITDRKKDLLVTSGGKNVAPSEIERLLISDPFIDQAVVYGDARPFVSALLVPNFANLQVEADKAGWSLPTEGTFITSQPVLEFFETRVASLMEAVSQPECVRRFLVLARPFQVEADELTATLKVRRRHIIQKYESELAALYQ